MYKRWWSFTNSIHLRVGWLEEGDSMNLSLIEKFGVIFKYIFSSFLSIEMFVLSLLLFVILIVNLKKNNELVQMIAIGIYIGFIIGILISYNTYVTTCINSFVKAIMNYVYFPSTIVYFFIIIFVTVMILYTLFSKKQTLCSGIWKWKEKQGKSQRGK